MSRCLVFLNLRQVVPGLHRFCYYEIPDYLQVRPGHPATTCTILATTCTILATTCTILATTCTVLATTCTVLAPQAREVVGDTGLNLLIKNSGVPGPQDLQVPPDMAYLTHMTFSSYLTEIVLKD